MPLLLLLDSSNKFIHRSRPPNNLSSKLNHVEGGLDYIAEPKDAIGQEVTQLHDDVGFFHANIESVRHVVQTLETQVHRIEGNEDVLHSKVRRLVGFAHNSRRSKSTDLLQASPSSALRPALEHPHLTPSSRTGSLPPVLFLEPPSSSSNGLNEVQQSMKTVVSAAGLNGLQGIAEALNFASKPVAFNDNPVSEATTESSSLGSFGRMLFASNSSLSRKSAGEPK